MLREIRLRRFRAFEEFRMSFGGGAYLVGPNNAGKSTLLTALRLADVLLRAAQRRNPTEVRIDGDRKLPTWPMSLVDFPALRESVRHEFGNLETRLELYWKNGASLTCVWPEEELDDDQDSPEPFFYLEQKAGMPIRNVQQARSQIPSLGVIPILGPIDHTERVLADSYVTRNISGRLSSRHFRNQLRILAEKGEFNDLIRFADPWLDGIQFEPPGRHLEAEGSTLDVFYMEPGSRIPKELVWSGDGIQVWLQLIYHVYRVRDAPTIILDEPEVYLHPDLQRRLVHLLEVTGKQIILATHSSEIVAEAEPVLVTLVDKTRKRARKASDEATLEWLSAQLGTAFNLRLARALRSKVALFVEGRDMTVLRRFARRLKLGNLETERGITVIKLDGFSKHDHVAPFAWLCGELLPDAIKTFVLLDRDYRNDESVTSLESDFRDAGIEAHVWRRKELESYLLTAATIARISGLQPGDAEKVLDEITLDMADDVFGRLLDEELRSKVSATRHRAQVGADFKGVFDERWNDPEFRLAHCPAKQVIAKLNRGLQEAGLSPVSVRSLASAHRVAEISPEMAMVLKNIELACMPRNLLE